MFSQVSVILSTGGGGVHDRGHAWQGVCMAEVGHAWRGGACVEGGMHARRDSHCSGRYASYWNAFLFIEMNSFKLLCSEWKVHILNSGNAPGRSTVKKKNLEKRYFTVSPVKVHLHWPKTKVKVNIFFHLCCDTIYHNTHQKVMSLWLDFCSM